MIVAFAGYAALCVFAITWVGMSCEGTEVSTEGNVFENIIAFATFTSCDGTPAWMSAIFFAAFTFPWFLLLAWFLFRLFNSTVGASVAIVLGVVTFLIGVF